MRKIILLTLFFVFTCLTIRAQKYNITDIYIKGVWLFEFGNKYEDVLSELQKRYPDNGIRTKEGEIGLLDIEFAGLNYDIVTLSFFENKYLYSIYFSKIYNLEHGKYAREVYDSLNIRLAEKYGKGNIIRSKDNDVFIVWEDKIGMTIFLTLTKGLSRGGKEFFYVDVEYENSQAYNNFIRKKRYEEM